METPKDLKYTKDHEWIKDGGSGTVTTGITAFAQSELGELVFVDLPAIGKVINRGETMCVVESTKAASDVYAPVSGKVVEVNTNLNDSPGLVNSDPYAQGWLVKLEGVDSSQLGELMDSEAYQKLVG